MLPKTSDPDVKGNKASSLKHGVAPPSSKPTPEIDAKPTAADVIIVHPCLTSKTEEIDTIGLISVINLNILPLDKWENKI